MGFAPIHTDRLLLRPMRSDDVAALHRRRNDPDVARYQTWTLPYPLDSAEQIFTDVADLDGPTDDQWFVLTVTDPDDTVVHGDVVVKLSWQGRTAEIGYTFAPESWGHGYAIEATDALVEYLFATVGVNRIEGMLHPGNQASAMVLERLGMLFEGHTRSSFWVGDENSDDWMYGMTRSDWGSWRARPRGRPERVELTEIGPDDLAAVAKLQTHKSQEHMVAPTLYSLAQALIPPLEDGAALAPWYRAVRADGDIVGFVMLSLPTPTQADPYLWRLLIDRLHQRRGIGRMVLDLVAESCRGRGETVLYVSWVPGRGSPEPLYLGYGFVPTGVIDDGEIEARLELSPS